MDRRVHGERSLYTRPVDQQVDFEHRIVADPQPLAQGKLVQGNLLEPNARRRCINGGKTSPERKS